MASLYRCLLLLLCSTLVACGTPDRHKPETMPPRILVITPEQYTYGGGTYLETLIEAAGGINAAHALNDYSQIADSQILALAPDIVLFSQTWTLEQIEAWSNAEVYAALPAVKHDKLYQLDFSLALADLEANRLMRIDALRKIIEK